MIDQDTLAEIKTTLEEVQKVETMLREALLLANLQHAYNNTPQNAHLHHVIHTTNAHYEALEKSIKHLTELAQRMIEQRQSGRLAFNQGWDARLNDLIDQLSAEEYSQLRRKLEKIKAGK